ncbi:MAG: DUF3810 family protein [Oscillospiraceae bacterium]
MRNLRGIIVAAVFGVLTWLMQQLAQHYSLLLDMAYPFASKTVQELLGGWSARVDFCVWQVILGVFLVAVAVSIGLMILFRWNFFRWLGWVLAPVSIAYFLVTCVWGLNYYNRPIQERHEAENRGLHCGGPAGCHAVLPGAGRSAGRPNEAGRKWRHDPGRSGDLEPVGGKRVTTTWYGTIPSLPVPGAR